MPKRHFNCECNFVPLYGMPLNQVLGVSMNWEAIGASGEIIGAIAVVVSIAYLAYQIRSNTKAMRASASFDATHSWAATNELVMSQTDEQLAVLTQTLDPTVSWDDVSAEDRTRLILGIRAMFQKLEGQYYLYKFGLLEEGLWNNRSTWAKGLIELPFYSKFWEIEIDQRVYSDEFVDILNRTESINVSLEALGGNSSDT